MTIQWERIVEKLPVGGIVSQGDNARIDARQYHLRVTVEDRAQLLAEAGRALRPILEQMQQRIAQLEHDNRLLKDTVEALAPVTRAELPPGPCPPGSAPWGSHAWAEHAPVHVGSEPVQEPPAGSWPASPPRSAPSNRPSLLEELRHGR